MRKGEEVIYISSGKKVSRPTTKYKATPPQNDGGLCGTNVIRQNCINIIKTSNPKFILNLEA